MHTKRLADYEKIVSESAQTEFRLQDTQVQSETVQFQLPAAKAVQLSATQTRCGGQDGRVEPPGSSAALVWQGALQLQRPLSAQ
jgi:hypothetical protein